jgi:intracellular septation protein
MLALALSALIGLALLLAWRWRPRHPPEPAVWILLACYVLLGAWALCFGAYLGVDREPAGLQVWKPTIVYWLLALVLLLAPPLGLGLPVKAILGTYFAFSSKEWRWLNRGFAILFTAIGSVNLLVAFTGSESEWIGFKYACMVNVLIIILLRLSFVWVDLAGRVGALLYTRAKSYFG